MKKAAKKSAVKKAAKKQAAKKPSEKRATKSGGEAVGGGSLIERTSATARAANERKGRDLIARIAAKIDQIERGFYEIGASLRELRAPAVWGALGAPSFEGLVETIPKMSRPLAYRLLRIVEHYEEKTAIDLGQTKALALITYVEATPDSDDAETLAREDAIVGGKKISEQTVRGILEAAAEARPPAERRKREGEDEARAISATLERLLEAATGEPVGVRLVHRKGKFRVLADLPIDLASAISVAKK